jgi:Lrp/AsnC family leucine-responsive transcriptional regulator
LSLTTGIKDIKGDVMDELDGLDRSILAELQRNARITVTDLAARVGLSKTPCQIRMRRLEGRGYILGYVALVDSTKLGLSHIAFVQVTLSDTSSKALSAFNEGVRAIVEVEQCHMIAGAFDYLLKIRTADMPAYRSVLGEKVSTLPHVLQTSTFAVMENVKDVETQLKNAP